MEKPNVTYLPLGQGCIHWPFACACGGPKLAVPDRVVKELIIFCFGLLYCKGRYLLVRRSKKLDHPRQIYFPGGFMPGGETWFDCLKREFKDQLGLYLPDLTSSCPISVHLQENVLRLVLGIEIEDQTVLDNLSPQQNKIEEILLWTDQQILTELEHPSIHTFMDSTREDLQTIIKRVT